MHPNTVTLTPLGSHTQTGAIARTIRFATLKAAVRMADVALRDHVEHGRTPPEAMAERVRIAKRRIEFLAGLRVELAQTSNAEPSPETTWKLQGLRAAIAHESLAILGMAANADLSQRGSILRFAAVEGVKFYQ